MDTLRNEDTSLHESFELTKLDWDTEYFGVRSAKVLLNDVVSREEKEIIKRFMLAYDFITITNIGNRSDNNFWIATETSAFQTDINIQFVKQLPRMPFKETYVTEVYDNYPRNKQIQETASKAFKYSRFFNDPWLPSKKAENLYAQWVENAFDKPGRYFVIAKYHAEIVGFLLFSMDLAALTARIELVAINEDHRGNSVGKSLISKMETVLNQKGILQVNVGTQLDNLYAYSFYTSCGFKLISYSSVYHHWPFK
ncbi:MAG: GNAT family N-acetyltransferase [Desulfitobacterium hafniense]|nr:GNAT family N-acetyltransferase [Desulfitobacterium hafniense]